MRNEPDERDNERSGLGNLGSLAQSARLKNLNTARNVMLVVGIILVLFHTYEFVTAREQLMRHIRQQNQVIVDQAAFDTVVTFARVIVAGAIGVGIALIVLGFLVKAYPIPCTILGLVLYVLYLGVLLILDPPSVAAGIIFKIIIIVSMIKAIQAAFAYEREKVTTLYEPD